MTIDTALMQGEHIRLWPYAEGYYRADTLSILWQLLIQNHAIESLFWGADQSELLDLASDENFRLYLSDRIVVLFESIEKSAIVGFCWFDQIYPGKHAHYSIFMDKNHRGKESAEATRVALDYAFDVLGFARVFGRSPWRSVVEHARRAGAKLIATIPGYTYINGGYRDVYIMMKEADNGR